jgi:hypothetical protein
VAQFGQARYTGVILKDFSPEEPALSAVEGIPRAQPQLPRGWIRSALDPSQAQDDPIMKGEIQTEPLSVSGFSSFLSAKYFRNLIPGLDRVSMEWREGRSPHLGRDAVR